MPVTAALLVLAATLPAAAQQPWDGPAFSGDPAAMLMAASAVPVAGDVNVVILLREDRFYFEADGRSTRTSRMVYRVMNSAGAEGWAGVRAEYSPWYQELPSIRARVITADGVAHMLDPATLGEGPAQDENSDQVYTDRRAIRGPLPAIAAEAVVEEETVLRETAPLLPAGVVHEVYFAFNVPRQRALVEISHPASLPLRYTSQLLPSLQVRKEEKGGRIVLTMEIGAMDPIKPIESLLPADVAGWPKITFATGPSWQHIAEYYGRLVDQQLSSADLSRVVATATKGKKSRPEIVAAVLARLHQDVRYTGVEYAEAAIIPRSPKETLERRYGDCKDKAGLFIAMLRQAGIPAHFALLSTGPGQDVFADLPGMGAFNHAIVYAPGTPDYWIDATAEDWRLGDLPPGDQGRLALIIAPETTALKKIPDSPSSANRFVETREFQLAEMGPARVSETTETFGSVEGYYRASYGEGGDGTRKQMEEYVKSAYLAESLEKFEHSPARDFSQPFRLHLEAGKAGRGQTSSVDAAVRISPWTLVNRLPGFLTQSEDDSQKTEKEKEEQRRKNDMELVEPYSAELRVRIVPPPGFRPLSVPENSVTQIGPSRLTQEFVMAKDGVVNAVLQFDTGKRRFTASEVEAMKTSLRKLAQSEMLLVSFEQVGRAHLAAGKTQEALAEFQNLAALHPKEALHRSQVAEALLAAGIADAARQEALRAIELEPGSAQAYRSQAWILQHDLVGRRLEKGWDPKGAEAAYRKALEIDKDDYLSRANLAILLEYNATGDRYGAGSNLAAAITEYEAIKDKLNSLGAENNLPITMLRAERFQQVRDLLKPLPANQARSAIMVAAVAAQESAPAALTEARKLSTDESIRNSMLVTAADYLVKLRRYPQAAELMTAGARTAENPGAVLGRADSFRKTQRHEDAALQDDDPRTVVRRFFIDQYTQPITDAFFRLYSRRVMNLESRKEEIDQLRRAVRQLRTPLAREDTPMSVIADLLNSLMQLSVEGTDELGYRIRTQSPGAQSQVFYVIREDGQYRILGVGSADSGVGDLVLDAVNKGNLEPARRWLDWVRDDQPPGGGEDPLSGSLLPRFWERGRPADATAMQYAAAAMLAGSEASAKAIPLLEQGRAKAASDADRTAFDLALARCYVKLEKMEALIPVAERLVQAAPRSALAFAFVQMPLRALKRWTEAERSAQERLKLLPDDVDALRFLSQGAMLQGRFDRVQEHHARLVAVGKAEARDFNQLAWAALVSDAVTPESIEAAQRGTSLSNNQSGAVIHTLACLYAEVGRTSEARERLLHLMEVWGLEEPDSETWFGFGRIAEQYGMREAAIAAYRRVETPKSKYIDIADTWSLAQRRLKGLGAASEKTR
ncbi:MAG: DUF3857 domain-containing protein [Terriglobales bacterium]